MFDVCSTVSVPVWIRTLIVLCSDAASAIEIISWKQRIEDSIVSDGWSMKMIVTRQRARIKRLFLFRFILFSLPVSFVALLPIVHLSYKPWYSSSLLICSNRQHGQHIADIQSLHIEPWREEQTRQSHRRSAFVKKSLGHTCKRNPVRIFIRSPIRASGQQQKNGVQRHSPARLNTWQQKHGQQK